MYLPDFQQIFHKVTTGGFNSSNKGARNVQNIFVGVFNKSSQIVGPTFRLQ